MIREAAAKAKVATQMGIQIHASDELPPRRRADPGERHRAGPRGPRLGVAGLGPAERGGGEEVEDHSAFKDGQIVGLTDRPKGSESRPSGLDWDLWLGPAPSGRSTRSMSPGRSGTAGGTSAAAP